MATDDTTDGGGGDTLKITETYLKDFANNQIKQLLDALRNDASLKAVQGFSQGNGSGTGPGPGQYSKLLGGGKTLDAAQQLQADFKSLCTQLDGMVQSLITEAGMFQLDLKTVDSTLTNGADEALSAADMMKVLTDVLNGINNLPSNPPPKA
ncbi:hypothetical protein [Kitasatospora sp. LaBMicrA B282]|uniref:hypothetical protein n=1 Tax=Kitasatospora sp. LaBMicrA B282 TaxID=3420949 RepID=UPI003D0B16F5